MVLVVVVVVVVVVGGCARKGGGGGVRRGGGDSALSKRRLRRRSHERVGVAAERPLRLELRVVMLTLQPLPLGRDALRRVERGQVKLGRYRIRRPGVEGWWDRGWVAHVTLAGYYPLTGYVMLAGRTVWSGSGCESSARETTR